MVGPGLTAYDLKITTENNLSPAQQEKLVNAVKQVITQRFPGMNYVFANKQFNASGRISTWSIGYRYIVHIGFLF
jgi:hypothetical protein